MHTPTSYRGTVSPSDILSLVNENNQLRAELAALKAWQGEAVYVVPVTGSLDEIDAPVWPFINAEAQKVGAEKGRIETYKYERANGGVAVLWDANRIHAMAVTIRDDMNRTRCIRILTAPPASADAVSVPREIALRMATDAAQYDHEHAVVHDNVQLWQQPNARVSLTVGDLRTVRALLAQSQEVKS